MPSACKFAWCHVRVWLCVRMSCMCVYSRIYAIVFYARISLCERVFTYLRLYSCVAAVICTVWYEYDAFSAHVQSLHHVLDTCNCSHQHVSSLWVTCSIPATAAIITCPVFGSRVRCLQLQPSARVQSLGHVLDACNCSHQHVSSLWVTCSMPATAAIITCPIFGSRARYLQLQPSDIYLTVVNAYLYLDRFNRGIHYAACVSFYYHRNSRVLCSYILVHGRGQFAMA
jgi:hypothetical protein